MSTDKILTRQQITDLRYRNLRAVSGTLEKGRIHDECKLHGLTPWKHGFIWPVTPEAYAVYRAARERGEGMPLDKNTFDFVEVEAGEILWEIETFGDDPAERIEVAKAVQRRLDDLIAKLEVQAEEAAHEAEIEAARERRCGHPSLSAAERNPGLCGAR